MSFLSGIFLFGLPLLGVPIAIHLLSRRRQEVVKWAAMQFLMDSNIRRRKIWRLDDLILMLLRSAAILGIILALSRPLWHRTGSSGGLGRDVVFLWDVSMSMERKNDDGQTTFDRMIEKSKELMDDLGTRDNVRGLVTIGRGKWLTAESMTASTSQKQQLLDELQKIGSTQATADWVNCLGAALRVSSPRNAKAKVIAVLTDGQLQGWHHKENATWQNLMRVAEESKIPVAVEIYNVNGEQRSIHNLSVDKLTTSKPLTGIGETILVDAEVHNYGQTAVEHASLNWTLNGTSLGTSSVGPLAPGQTKQVSMKHTMATAGISRLRCHLDVQDHLESDNERTLVVEAVEKVPLLLVDDTTESDPLKSDKGYLLAALGHHPTGELTEKNAGVFRVTTITSAELAQHSCAEYRAILFANTPDLDEHSVKKLMDFVRAGGGLWLALGDQTHVGDFNRGFYRMGAGLSPWPVEESKGDLIRREEFLTVHPPEGDHPATIVLSDTQRLDVDRMKVFQHFPFALSTAKAHVPVLLQSGTGDALAVENQLGRGRVIVQALPMGVRWSNLPLTQAFVPLVHEWTWYLIQPTAISRNLQPGETILALLPQNENIQEVQLVGPDKRLLTLTPSQKGDQSSVQSRETQWPGSYEVVVKIEGKDDSSLPYEVSRNGDESNLEPWTQEFTTQWSASPAMRLNPTTPLTVPVAAAGQRLGEPLWVTLLALVIVAFFSEMWLVRRIARKRFAGRTDSTTGRFGSNSTLGSTLAARGGVQ